MAENIKVSDIPLNERPVEKLLQFGVESLSNEELLAILLRTGTKGENVIALSRRLLIELDGLDGLLNVSFEKASKIKGVKKVGSKVGEKGQIVIPKEARDMFDIRPGDSIIVLCDKSRGIALLKADTIDDLSDKVFPKEKN